MIARVRNLIQQRWWKTVLPLVFIVLLVWFVVQQRTVMQDTLRLLQNSNPPDLLFGLGLVLAYIVLQGLNYQTVFRAIHKHIPLWKAIELYLKRFFLGTFLPAGFTVSQYAYQRGLKPYGITNFDNHLASTIYLGLGSLSYMVLLLPTTIYLFFSGRLSQIGYYAAGFVMLFIVGFLISAVRVFRQQGTLYRLLSKVWPDAGDFLSTWREKSLDYRWLFYSFVSSLLQFVIGILLFVVTFQALNTPQSLTVAIISYVITWLVVYISPVFQGIGLVELSLVEVLMQYGLPHATAVGVTVLYRVFQLWLPLLISGSLIAWQRLRRLS